MLALSRLYFFRILEKEAQKYQSEDTKRLTALARYVPLDFSILQSCGWQTCQHLKC